MSDPYGPPPGTQPTPGPAGIPGDDKTWALAAHIGSLVTAWFAFGFLAPLLVMLVKADSPFVRRHAVESLNFQISLLIYSVVAAVLGFVITLFTFGLALFLIIPVVAVLAVVVLVLIVIATMKASNGDDYRYPLTLRLIS